MNNRWGIARGVLETEMVRCVDMETHAGLTDVPALLRRGLREDRPIKIASCSRGERQRGRQKIHLNTTCNW